MNDLTLILWAASAMCSIGVAVFYLRFWRQTGDRLFAWFALAFLLLAANWSALALVEPREESRHLLYLLRLAAFLVLLLAIVDKNRGDRAGGG
jgi:hypothetical protein